MQEPSPPRIPRVAGHPDPRKSDLRVVAEIGAAAKVATAADGSGHTVAGGIDCGSGSATIPRLPIQVRSFFGAEYVFGPHVSVMAELLPTSHVRTSFVTTDVRVLLGFDRPREIVALDRIKLRLDLGTIWTYVPAEPASNRG
jgi:hypothetical protein